MTALFPSLSLYLPVPIFSWLLLLLRQVPWVCCLAFPRVVRTQLGLGFLMLPACPSPSIGLLVYWFQWLLFSTGVPYLRDGVTPAGSRIVCPLSERRFSLHLGQVHWSVPGWTSHLCLRVSACPVPQGVLPSGPRCVHKLRFSLALPRVLHCPLLGFSVTSPALARGLGLSFVHSPHFCRLGLVPRSVAQLCALQPLMPSFRVCLSEAAGFGGFLVLSIVLH